MTFIENFGSKIHFSFSKWPPKQVGIHGSVSQSRTPKTTPPIASELSIYRLASTWVCILDFESFGCYDDVIAAIMSKKR